MTTSAESKIAATDRPADPDPADAPHAAAPLLAGRYALGPRLGEGGMGVVYQAHDEMLQRTVAIKLFRDGTENVARTAAETRMLAGLNHPSLVTLFDAHVGAETPRYLVMEHVDGPTLSERLAAGPLRSSTVAIMARDLADALRVVHSAGIVHRDIKPTNVLLRLSTVPGEEFRAKLADFGIAYLIDSARLTTPGMVIGSAAYLAPEQVRGAAPAPASDIYALGLLLLEALTGRRAFAQESVHEAAIVRLTYDPVIPSNLGPEWCSLLASMTAREPADRPTALELVTTLTGFDPTGSGERHAVTAYTKLPSESEPESPTLVAPVASLPTVVEPAMDDALPTRRGAAPAHRGRASRRRWALFAGAVVAAALIGAVLVPPLLSGAEEAPAPPTLPTLDEPLDSHIRQLMDAVTP